MCWERSVYELCCSCIRICAADVCSRGLSRVVLTDELDDLYNKATVRVLVKHTLQPVWLL